MCQPSKSAVPLVSSALFAATQRKLGNTSPGTAASKSYACQMALAPAPRQTSQSQALLARVWGRHPSLAKLQKVPALLKVQRNNVAHPIKGLGFKFSMHPKCINGAAAFDVQQQPSLPKDKVGSRHCFTSGPRQVNVIQGFAVVHGTIATSSTATLSMGASCSQCYMKNTYNT